jgi:hypothetical protein
MIDPEPSRTWGCALLLSSSATSLAWSPGHTGTHERTIIGTVVLLPARYRNRMTRPGVNRSNLKFNFKSQVFYYFKHVRVVALCQSSCRKKKT